MKTVEDLRTRIKELSKQAVDLRKQASEIYETDKEQAKHFRDMARDSLKRCEVLRQELKRTSSFSI